MAPVPDQPVLLIHTGAIGDFVLALALLNGLTAERSSVKLHALCRCRLACFFAKRGFLAGWKHIEQPTYLPLFAADLAAHSALQTYLDSFDMIIAMLGHTDAVTSQCLRSTTRTKSYCIDPVLRQSTEQQGRHITDQWLYDLAEQELSIPRDLIRPAAEPSRKSCESLEDVQQPRWPPAPAPSGSGHFVHNSQLSTLNSLTSSRDGFSRASAGNRILIHPGSGGMAKCWPLTDFEELAARLVREGRDVQFMLGPAEMERFDEPSRRSLARIAPVLYEEDVCDAAEHMASAAVFVGNDAGMTHLAAFLGVPTVAIFTATDPAVWRPIGDRVSIIDARDTDPPSLDRIFSTLHKLIGAG